MARPLFVVLALLLLLGSRPVAAQGLADYVEITGPGLAKPLILHGEAAHPMGMWLMNIPYGLSQRPAHLDRYYTLTRDHWDVARYYPNPAGGRGYIFYVGSLQGSSGYDGQWFTTNALKERALQYTLDHPWRASGGAPRSLTRPLPVPRPDHAAPRLSVINALRWRSAWLARQGYFCPTHRKGTRSR